MTYSLTVKEGKLKPQCGPIWQDLILTNLWAYGIVLGAISDTGPRRSRGQDEIRMRAALHSPISRLSPASLQSDTENKDVVPKNLDSEAKFRGIHAEKLQLSPRFLNVFLHCISIDVT